MNRSRVVKVRVTEAEFEDWNRRALGASVSLSEAVRRAMEAWPRPGGLEPFLGTGWAELPDEDALAPFIPVVHCEHGRPKYVYCPRCK